MKRNEETLMEVDKVKIEINTVDIFAKELG